MRMVNKDHMRKILLEEKRFMPLEDVKTVNMPKWDELSVKHMWPKMKAIEGFMLYMPDRLPKKILPDREYFFNIMNSINPDYVQKAIQHAAAQRNSVTEQNAESESILLSANMQALLQEKPFQSGKSPLLTDCE